MITAEQSRAAYLIGQHSSGKVTQAQNINNTRLFSCSFFGSLLEILLFWKEQRCIFSSLDLQWMVFPIAPRRCGTQTDCCWTISPRRAAGCRLGEEKGREELMCFLQTHTVWWLHQFCHASVFFTHVLPSASQVGNLICSSARLGHRSTGERPRLQRSVHFWCLLLYLGSWIFQVHNRLLHQKHPLKSEFQVGKLEEPRQPRVLNSIWLLSLWA